MDEPVSRTIHRFPRDPGSPSYHIAVDAVRRSALVLIADTGFERRAEFVDSNLKAFLADQGGWNVIDVLTKAAACAIMKGLDDRDYDTALVKQALIDHLGWQHQ